MNPDPVWVVAGMVALSAIAILWVAKIAEHKGREHAKKRQPDTNENLHSLVDQLQETARDLNAQLSSERNENSRLVGLITKERERADYYQDRYDEHTSSERVRAQREVEG